MSNPQYCPFCKREFFAAGEVGHNSKLERGVFECPHHGEMEIEWPRRAITQEGRSE